MVSEITGSSNILILVGSKNKVKVDAARDGIVKILPKTVPESVVRAIGLDADHGITDWRSMRAEGQPFGLQQTAFGAVNRMKQCWSKAKEHMQEPLSHLFVVGLENGLVEGREIGKDPDTWYDICVTAVSEVFSKSGVVVKQGESVATEFGRDKSLSFDDQVVEYQKAISSKTDLYLEWTKHLEGGPFTRADYLRNCFVGSLSELSVIGKAKQLVEASAKEGVVASLGPRYKNMHWMRDLAYMTPAFVRLKQKEALAKALRVLCEGQCQKHELFSDGYTRFNRFGNMPIVVVSGKGERDFLLQRLRGTHQDPYWQIQLWNLCKQQGALADFPAPVGKTAATEPPDLIDCSVRELREYYHRLLQFRDKLALSLKVDEATLPRPSYALRCFMDGMLGNLTPGTRDSEIHFIRALFALGDEALIQEFAKPLAGAFFYLYMNVIDQQDGLPRGCDSRDIFADMLYDAKTLTNATFWYEALQAVQKLTHVLEKTAFRAHIAEAIAQSSHVSSPISSQKVPEILLQLGSRDAGAIVAGELEKLKASIQEKLLFKNGVFSPRDFIPGTRAALSLSHPITPSPANGLVAAYNPDFVRGEGIDPQSLAYSVLQGLIPEKEYGRVVDYFQKEDSPIGVAVFVPISGKTQEETALLQSVKGRVVWPHISWTVFRALIAMGTVESMHMAHTQREKLIKLGFGEWYALKEGKAVQGGDPEQGWSASSILIAEHEFYERVSKSRANKS